MNEVTVSGCPKSVRLATILGWQGVVTAQVAFATCQQVFLLINRMLKGVIHCESKRDLYTFAHNFGRCWRFFEIFPLLNSSRNLQQTDCHIAHHTLNVLLHYLAKWQMSQTAIFISFFTHSVVLRWNLLDLLVSPKHRPSSVHSQHQVNQFAVWGTALPPLPSSWWRVSMLENFLLVGKLSSKNSNLRLVIPHLMGEFKGKIEILRNI